MCNEWTSMVLLRLHVWYLTSRDVSSDPYWTASVDDLAAAVTVLQWIEVISDLSVVSVRVDRLVLVEARDGSHWLLLHGELWLKLSVLWMIFMAIDDNWRHPAVLMIVSHINVRSRWSLRVIMVIPSAIGKQMSIKLSFNNQWTTNFPHTKPMFIYNLHAISNVMFNFYLLVRVAKISCQMNYLQDLHEMKSITHVDGWMQQQN